MYINIKKGVISHVEMIQTWLNTIKDRKIGNIYFRIETMFGSSLPPVVNRRVHVLFVLFV